MTLAILATAAIILIFGEPYEESRTWYSDFFFQKALGFLCVLALVLIHRCRRSRQTSKD